MACNFIIHFPVIVAWLQVMAMATTEQEECLSKVLGLLKIAVSPIATFMIMSAKPR